MDRYGTEQGGQLPVMVAVVTRLGRDGNGGRRPLVADGRVAFAEMKEAALADAACMRHGSLTVEVAYRDDIRADQRCSRRRRPAGSIASWRPPTLSANPSP